MLADGLDRRPEEGPDLGSFMALRAELALRVAALEDEVVRLNATVADVTARGLPAPLVAPAEAERRRRRVGVLPAALFATGALVTADAVVTVVWQEPLTALYADREQASLDRELSALDRDFEQADVRTERELGARLREGAGVEARRARAQAQRERIASLAAQLTRRSKAGAPVGKLRIPRTGTNVVVVHGTGGRELRRGPGHYPHTVLPGRNGTFGVAGHRTSWSAPFRRINQLRKGDRITVTMPYGRFTYAVTTKRIVKPEDVWVLERRDVDRIVLTACHPLFSAAKRIVISAELRQATPRGAARRA